MNPFAKLSNVQKTVAQTISLVLVMGALAWAWQRGWPRQVLTW